MNWMEISALAGVGSVVVALLTALAVVFFKHLLPSFKGGSTFLKNCVGAPENKKTGQPYVPSIFERFDIQDEVLAKQNGVLETIRHEVEFNNGSSVKDGVMRTEAGLADVQAELTHIKALIGGNGQTTTINVNQKDTTP